MSFIDDLLIILTSYSGGYRLIKKRLSSYYADNTYRNDKINLKDETLRKTLSRLKKRGLVSNAKYSWKITAKGKKYIATKLSDHLKFHSPYPKPKKSEKDKMIIAFDIPERFRRSRAWLRTDLRLLEFKPLQKSVWIGPAPLPQQFIKALQEINLLEYIKFFKVSTTDVI